MTTVWMIAKGVIILGSAKNATTMHLTARSLSGF